VDRRFGLLSRANPDALDVFTRRAFPKFSAQHRNVGLWFESPSDLDRSTWMSGLNRQTVCGQRHKPSKQRGGIEHAAHLGDLTEAILATGSVYGELLGEPSAELRPRLADSEVPRLFTPYISM
jgi:hypothetical protein